MRRNAMSNFDRGLTLSKNTLGLEDVVYKLEMEKQVESSHSVNRKTFDEMASESIRGVDEPMENNHPEGSALLVFAAYPVFLIVGILMALILLWWWKFT